MLAATIVPQQSFFQQPIDVVLSQFLVTFGWIPIVVVLLWGFIQMWQNYRQGIYVSGLSYILLAVDIPPMTEQSPKAIENMFTMLYGGYSSLTWKEKWIIGKVQPVWSFEIASTEGYVQFYVRTQVRYRDQIESGIYAQYPDAEITEVEDYTTWAPEHFPGEEYEMWGSELAIKKDQIFPIRTYVDFEDKLTQEIKDPLAQILEGMARMKPGEHYWFQILIQPNGNDWKKKGEAFVNKVFGVEAKHKPGAIESGLSAVVALPSMVIEEATGVSVSGMMFGSHDEKAQEDIWKAFKLTAVEREQVEGVMRKIAKTAFLTKLRMVYVAKKGVFDKNARTAFVKGFLAQFSHLNWNQIGLYSVTTPKDDYFWQRWVYTEKQARLMKGFKRRGWGTGATPKFMSVEELASLWHFPGAGSRAPLVKRAEARRAEPPVGLPMTLEELDLPKGPPTSAPSTPPPPPMPAVQTSAPQGAHAEPALPKPSAPTHAANIPDAAVSSSHAAPPIVQVEEREPGLDATDMGPPADVKLPGPPPGWNEPPQQAPQRDEPPPNLPV